MRNFHELFGSPCEFIIRNPANQLHSIEIELQTNKPRLKERGKICGSKIIRFEGQYPGHSAPFYFQDYSSVIA
jgi:hypothetical protein